MRSVFIFAVYILLHCIGCASTKKVIFVYDKVDTTAYDVDWLTGKVNDLSTICSNEGLDYQFELSFPYKSSNFASFLTDSRIEGKSTLKFLLTWLKQSPPYSVIYVITNATTPSDETPVDEILEEIQIKRTEVNFLIGTNCSYEDDWGTDSLNKYAPITLISNGYITGPKSFQSDQFTESMHMRLTSASLRVIFPAVLHKDDKTYCMDYDSSSEAVDRVMIDIKFDLYKYEDIAGNFDRSLEISSIEWTMSVALTTEWCDSDFYKLFGMSTRELPTRIQRKGITRSQFEFHYGFSTKYVRSLNETYRRPIKGISNKIYVSAVDKSSHYEFIHFQIIFLNDTIRKCRTSICFGKEIPLQSIPGTDLFVGSFGCEPPTSQYFYIKVNIHTNGVDVSRISSTAMTVAEGFGDEYRNPMFERNPGFETEPASSKSKDNAGSYISIFSNQIILSICIGSLGLFFGFAAVLLRKFRIYVFGAR